VRLTNTVLLDRYMGTVFTCVKPPSCHIMLANSHDVTAGGFNTGKYSPHVSVKQNSIRQPHYILLRQAVDKGKRPKPEKNGKNRKPKGS